MKKYLLSFVTGFVLSACGSSGGGSSAQPAPSTPANNPQNLPLVTPVQPVVKAIDQVPEQFKAQIREEKLVKLPTPSNNASFYDLASEPEGWVTVENVGDNITLRAYNLPYSAIGYAIPQNTQIDSSGRVIDERVTADNNFDSVGLNTKFADIEGLGTARYQGVAFGANSQGKMALNADFANKTVEGRLYDRTTLTNRQSLPEITLEKGQIIAVDGDASFIGSTKATLDGNRITTTYGGDFMGPKAEEVNGVVLDNRGEPYEAFAGKK